MQSADKCFDIQIYPINNNISSEYLNRLHSNQLHFTCFNLSFYASFQRSKLSYMTDGLVYSTVGDCELHYIYNVYIYIYIM